MIVTEQDSQAMTCRWVKLAIHRELELVLASAADVADEIHLDLEVEGTMVEGTNNTSLLLEAEEQAAKILHSI